MKKRIIRYIVGLVVTAVVTKIMSMIFDDEEGTEEA